MFWNLIYDIFIKYIWYSYWNHLEILVAANNLNEIMCYIKIVSQVGVGCMCVYVCVWSMTAFVSEWVVSLQLYVCVCLSVNIKRTEQERKPHQLFPSIWYQFNTSKCKHRQKNTEKFLLLITKDLEKDEGVYKSSFLPIPYPHSC